METGNRKRKGLWTEEEDSILTQCVRVHGTGRWNKIAKITGLKRGGKSCRLRWNNYLSPTVKHGDFSEDEDDLIIRLHNLLGNRWSLIAGRIPGRTDNQVKNHWNTHLSKKLGVNKDAIKSSKQRHSLKSNKHLSNNSSFDRGVSQEATEDCSDSVVVGSWNNDQQSIIMSSSEDYYLSSCWFVGDDMLHSLSLMDLLHESPYDLWSAL